MFKQNILFRADSSSQIGTGHIMRDLVLAKQFEDAKIVFAVQELSGNINDKIKETGYAIEILRSNAADELVMLIQKYEIDMVVIDHYGIDEAYEKRLKEQTGVKLMVLDDTYEKHHCDILLNHNIYADADAYSGLVPMGCELRCGGEYTLLREEFFALKQQQKIINHKRDRVFIAMGGADSANLNAEIVKALEGFSSLEIDIVTTTANAHLNALEAFVQDKPYVKLHINAQNIASLMKEADFAIVTPSVTLNEIFFMDVPFIAIQTATNQRFMVEYLQKNHYMILQHFDASKLHTAVERLRSKAVLRNFTALSLEEKEMILEWRNDASIRRWMFTQEPIALENHLRYIDTLLSRQDRCYFLVYHKDEAIGVVDFTSITSQSANIGLYAKPSIRGVGGILMEAIITYGFDVLGVTKLISEVFEENEPAIRLYTRCGFEVKARRENIIIMEKTNENR